LWTPLFPALMTVSNGARLLLYISYGFSQMILFWRFRSTVAILAVDPTDVVDE
jgi:hypothetical protein